MEKRLYRDVSNKVLGGVASGLAEYLVVDVTVIRIAFLLLFFLGGGGLLLYLIMWIVVPAKKNFNYTTDYRMYGEPSPQRPVAEPRVLSRNRSGNERFWAGFVLLLLGLYFLFSEFHFIPYWFSIGKLWPLIFIIPGLIILANSRRKEEITEEPYTFNEVNREKTEEPRADTGPIPPAASEETGTPSSNSNPINPDPTNDKI